MITEILIIFSNCHEFQKNAFLSEKREHFFLCRVIDLLETSNDRVLIFKKEKLTVKQIGIVNDYVSQSDDEER